MKILILVILMTFGGVANSAYAYYSEIRFIGKQLQRSADAGEEANVIKACEIVLDKHQHFNESVCITYLERLVNEKAAN